MILLTRRSLAFTCWLAFFFTLPSVLFAERMMDSVGALTLAWVATENQVDQGEFNDALFSAKKAVHLAEEQFGPLNPSVAPYYDNLAVIDQYLALYPEAELNLKWGLALREKSLSATDPSVAQSLQSLAFLYDQWGRFEEADLAIQRALAIEKLPSNTPSRLLILSLNLAADIQDHLGQPDHARASLKEALDQNHQTADSAPLEIRLLTHLASIEEKQKNLLKAQTYLQQALEVAKKNANGDNVALADCRKKLSDFFAASGHPAQSKTLAAQALTTDLHYIGSVDAYANLPYHQRGADAYAALGRWADANALYERILKIKLSVFGPSHPETALTLEDLAQSAAKLKEPLTAKKDIQKAFVILQKYFGPDHPLVLDARDRLATLAKTNRQSVFTPVNNNNQ